MDIIEGAHSVVEISIRKTKTICGDDKETLIDRGLVVKSCLWISNC